MPFISLFLAAFVINLTFSGSVIANPQNNEPIIQQLLKAQSMLETRLVQLETKKLEQEEQISQLKTKIVEMESTSCRKPSQSQLEKNARTVLPPSSCKGLATIGHDLSGYYSVKGSSNKMDVVFCDFTLQATDPGFETRIGYNDIKTSPVHFYVQKSGNFPTAESIVPFEIERLNVGGAMNMQTSIFTAPVNGVYHFSLSGIKDTVATALILSLRVNNVEVGASYGAPTTAQQTYSLQSTLALKKGDRVNIYKTTGTVFDNVYHYTHFTGWLVEEDLVLN